MADSDEKNKVSTSFGIDREQREKLRGLSRVTRVPMSKYIREGIELVLQRYEAELNKGKQT